MLWNFASMNCVWVCKLKSSLKKCSVPHLPVLLSFASFWLHWTSSLREHFTSSGNTLQMILYTPECLSIGSEETLRWWVLFVTPVHLPSPKTLRQQSSALLMLTGSHSRVWLSSILCSANFQFVSGGTWLSGSNLWVIGDELKRDGSWFSFRWCFAESIAVLWHSPVWAPPLTRVPSVFTECFLFFRVLSDFFYF